MVLRAQAYFATAIVCTCALAALLGLPFWTSLVGGLCLALSAIWNHEKLRPRFVAVRAAHMLTTTNFASLADSCLVTSAAWCVGAAFRFLLQTV
jgi:hypothetical protein